jgi:hypothetical protein
MAWRIRKNWQWLLGAVAVVVAFLLADGGIRYFVWQTNTQALKSSVSGIAQRWDDFIGLVASQLLFQRTMEHSRGLACSFKAKHHSPPIWQLDRRDEEICHG